MTTLAQVKALADQLRPQEQLELVAHLSEQLVQKAPRLESKKTREQRKREARELLREFDRIASKFSRRSDSAETVRRMRDERIQQLWRNT